MSLEMAKFWKHPFNALAIHGIRVTPLIHQAEAETLKDQSQEA